MKRWLANWGTDIRQSSAYYPQSNGRAEAAVKSLKRLLRGNTGHNGNINTDAVARALLQYRNTPLRGVDKSPAELAVGRQLRDTLPLPRHRYKVSPHWAQHLRNREKTLSEANNAAKQKYDEHAHNLPPLMIGDTVRCQNTRTNKWDRTGIVLENKGHRQYSVKMSGSGRISLRNHRHVKKAIVHTPEIPHHIPACDIPKPNTSQIHHTHNVEEEAPTHLVTNNTPPDQTADNAPIQPAEPPPAVRRRRGRNHQQFVRRTTRAMQEPTRFPEKDKSSRNKTVAKESFY